jgi:uncharacterized protein (TIGR02118 family)
MIKVIVLLVRTDGLTHAEFADYWFGDHVEMAKALPGLRKYVTSLPADPEACEYDGVAEVYFESREALREAWATELGERLVEDERQFLDREACVRLVVEETVRVDDLAG